MSDARANIEIGATSSRLSRGLAVARAKIGAFASLAARGVSAAFNKMKLGDVGKTALGNLGGNIATRGLDAITDTAQGVRDFERNLIRFQIATDGTTESTSKLRAQVRQVSRDTAIGAAEVLAGSSSYVALTGDAEGASTAMAAFARIAQASGASVSDVATATAALKTSMGLQAGDIEAAFSAMLIQGKGGAVEVKDLAGELAELAPQFAQFRGGKGLGGIREMGAAFQTIMTGAGSASGAATQFSALIGAFADPETARRLEKVKIKVFDKDPATGIKSMRSASDIIEDIAKNEQLVDPQVISAIFGRKEAQAAVRSLRNHIGMFRELKVAAEDTGAVQRDLDSFLESDAGRMDKAFNAVKVAIMEAFTPERIKAFTNAVEDLAGKLGPIVDGVGWVADKLGGLAGVGKAIRGAFEGEQNPYAEDNETFLRRTAGTGYKIGGDNSPAAVAERKRRDAENFAQAEAFRAARDSITGGEVGERSTPESIKRAVVSSYRATNTNASPGDRAAASAGSTYLDEAGVTPAQQREIMGKAMADSLMQTGIPKIAAAIREGLAATTLAPEIGRKEIVVAGSKSSVHGTRPGGVR